TRSCQSLAFGMFPSERDGAQPVATANGAKPPWLISDVPAKMQGWLFSPRKNFGPFFGLDVSKLPLVA
ncbi:MAG: hypothetical protein ABIY47_14265, partial [Opitutaceae bacterium]